MRLTEILQPLPMPMPPISWFVAVGIAAELVAVAMYMPMDMEVDMPDMSMASGEIRWLQLGDIKRSDEVECSHEKVSLSASTTEFVY
jgi:hypothetical protein